MIDTSIDSVESQINGSEDLENSSTSVSGALETEYEDDWPLCEIESRTMNDCEVKQKETKPKRKHVKEDKYEKTISVFERVLAQSKDTDVRFLELEEKILKLEELQLELEDRHLREEQERETQRREEREFQQNLFALCSGGMPAVYNPRFNPFNN